MLRASKCVHGFCVDCPDAEINALVLSVSGVTFNCIELHLCKYICATFNCIELCVCKCICACRSASLRGACVFLGGRITKHFFFQVYKRSLKSSWKVYIVEKWLDLKTFFSCFLLLFYLITLKGRGRLICSLIYSSSAHSNQNWAGDQAESLDLVLGWQGPKHRSHHLLPPWVSVSRKLQEGARVRNWFRSCDVGLRHGNGGLLKC